MKRIRPFLLALFVVLPWVDNSYAFQLDRGNVLVSYEDEIREYSRDGELLDSISVPYPAGPRPAGESSLDLSVDMWGNIHVYNGKGDPYLSTYDPVANNWGHVTYPGWSRIGGPYGGIAAYDDFVFVTDMTTFGPGDTPKGIIRFNRLDSTATRIATDIEPIDLNIGLDGYLYALSPGGSPSGRFIDVYDPVTLNHIRTINLRDTLGHTGHNALAVDSDGLIYLVDIDADVQKLDQNGNLLLSTNVQRDLFDVEDDPDGDLLDIDISMDGLLALGEASGRVYLLDTSLQLYNYFSPGLSFQTFVTFVPDLDGGPTSPTPPRSPSSPKAPNSPFAPNAPTDPFAPFSPFDPMAPMEPSAPFAPFSPTSPAGFGEDVPMPVSTNPEPATLLLMSTGLAGLLIKRSRSRVSSLT